jgi:hypothetical protein
MNVKLLRKVAEHISEEPRRLNMTYISRQVPSQAYNAPPCGTVGCIAGWACMVEGLSVDEASWRKGTELLELTEDQAFRLFDFPTEEGLMDGWPRKFGKKYVNAVTPKAKAKAAVDRIEHFIATKGAE